MLWDAVSFLFLNQPPIWKLLDHWLSYKTMMMLWCFGNFPVDLNLWIFVGCLRFFKQLRSIRCLVSEVDLLDLFKAGHQKLVQVKTSERVLMPMRV